MVKTSAININEEREEKLYKLLVSLDNHDRNIFKRYFDFITEYFLQSSNKGEKLGINELGVIEIGDFKFENDDDNLGFSFVVIYEKNMIVKNITEKIKSRLPEEVTILD